MASTTWNVDSQRSAENLRQALTKKGFTMWVSGHEPSDVTITVVHEPNELDWLEKQVVQEDPSAHVAEN